MGMFEEPWINRMINGTWKKSNVLDGTEDQASAPASRGTTVSHVGQDGRADLSNNKKNEPQEGHPNQTGEVQSTASAQLEKYFNDEINSLQDDNSLGSKVLKGVQGIGAALGDIGAGIANAKAQGQSALIGAANAPMTRYNAIKENDQARKQKLAELLYKKAALDSYGPYRGNSTAVMAQLYQDNPELAEKIMNLMHPKRPVGGVSSFIPKSDSALYSAWALEKDPNRKALLENAIRAREGSRHYEEYGTGPFGPTSKERDYGTFGRESGSSDKSSLDLLRRR